MQGRVHQIVAGCGLRHMHGSSQVFDNPRLPQPLLLLPTLFLIFNPARLSSPLFMFPYMQSHPPTLVASVSPSRYSASRRTSAASSTSASAKRWNSAPRHLT